MTLLSRRYLEAYRQANLEFWGLTPQNEPLSHIYVPEIFNGMAWTAEQERNWVVEYLSPTLKKSNFGHIKIFSADENRIAFPNWIKTTFANEKARDIFSGVAIHFYFDAYIGPSVLDEMKQLFPEKSLIYTEACTGTLEG
jgi:glucosylceramidase